MNTLHAQQLIERYLAGDLAEEDREELERLLLGSREARILFWEVCGTHAALVEWGRAHWGRVVALAPHQQQQPQQPASGPLLDRLPPTERSFPGSRSAAVALAGGAAVVVLMTLAAWMRFPAITDIPAEPPTVSPPARSSTRVAWVADSSDAVWAEPQSVAVGDEVVAGPLRLLAGIAQLRFASGATVALNGPVDLEIVNEKRIFLRSGAITPFVPPRAHGFTVVSPSGEVVDLGTEFSIGVDADGRTSVYVIDGEVDVASGHARRGKTLRMTQGFGANLLSPAQTSPRLTQEPIVLDHFANGREVDTVGGAAFTPLRWIDVDPGKPARIEAGSLMIPIDNETVPDDPAARILLDHDFSRLAGRRSTIAFKATLPAVGSASFHRWLAFVIDADSPRDTVSRVPLAYSEEAAAAVMVSPEWQASLRIRGRTVPTPRIFQRDEEAIGPYQILVTIDDSPEGRRQHGGTTLSLMVNGAEVASRQRIDLGEPPRLGFHTFLPPPKGRPDRFKGRGGAFVDDFSVSVAVEPDME